MIDWRPIETVPKNGTAVMLCEYIAGNDLADAYIGTWSLDGYWLVNCGQPVVYTPEPTHWAPLNMPTT